MGDLNLQWNNTLVAGNANATGQRVSKRLKSLGGAFSTTGFTPNNDLPKSATTATASAQNNKIYQFKVEAICSIGGPIANDNGLREGVVFECLTPVITKTASTVNVKVDLTDTDISGIQFYLRNANTTANVASVYVARNGNQAEANFSGLTGGTAYYVEYDFHVNMYANADTAMSTLYPTQPLCGKFNVTTDQAVDLFWKPYQKTCLREGLFSVDKVITGLADPHTTWWDETLKRMWVSDLGDTAGNVYWFNPETAVNASSMTHSTKVVDQYLYNSYIDGKNRRIYFVGKNTNGLTVYNMDTDTVTTVTFGTNGDFRRTLLTVTEDNIYCNDATTSIIVIDRATLTISSTRLISTIPTPAHFNSGPFNMIEVNGNLWVNGNRNDIGTVGVYTKDLNVLIVDITLPGASVWSGGSDKWWQSIYWDRPSQQVYVTDIGSHNRYVIHAFTRLVLNSRSIDNREGKSTAQIVWTTNPVTKELLAVYTAYNDSTQVSPIFRVYVEDRATFQYRAMYRNQNYKSLALIEGTSKVAGPNPSGYGFSGTSGWQTDGSITILGAGSGLEDLTGDQVIDNLILADHNNSDQPVIPNQIKPNVQGDPDYKPPVIDSPECAIAPSVACPTDIATTFASGVLNYEFSISPAVRKNPAVLKVRVYAINQTGNVINGSPVVYPKPFAGDYFSGSISGLPGTTYKIRIQFLGTADAILANCNA